MKKHFLTTVLALTGLLMLSSCLKDDPANETIFYAYQQIPNINDYMPQTLLYAMGENNLYYGDEPPKIEGEYTTDNTSVSRVILIPESHWLMNEGVIPGYRHFNFFEQHMGIAQLDYLYFNYTGNTMEITQIERSNTDSTYLLSKDKFSEFATDSLFPIYFKDSQIKPDVFKNIYIIGHDPYFTIYYYDVIHTNMFQPLKANIISGKIDKEFVVETDTVSGTTDTIVRPVIKNFKWGIQIMRYYKGGTILDMILNPPVGQQRLGKPGDVIIIENPTAVHHGEFQE